MSESDRDSGSCSGSDTNSHDDFSDEGKQGRKRKNTQNDGPRPKTSQKKNKKRKNALPPQQVIDQFWAKFRTKHPGKGCYARQYL